MSWVRNRLESRSAKSAKKGGSLRDAEAAWNRPELPEHSQSIAKYLLENYEKAYIIPPLSLNIQHRVHLYLPDYPSDFIPGYLVIPGSATLAITDGQHRRTGIVQAMDQMDEATSARFASDAVAIMITCETDLNRSIRTSPIAAKPSRCRRACLQSMTAGILRTGWSVISNACARCSKVG
jgi:hypothetical protein